MKERRKEWRIEKKKERMKERLKSVSKEKVYKDNERVKSERKKCRMSESLKKKEPMKKWTRWRKKMIKRMNEIVKTERKTEK